MCRWASQLSINWCYHFWWVRWGMAKVLKISIVFLNAIKKEWIELWSWWIHADNHESLEQLDSVICDGFGQAFHLKKEVRNEVRDLTALTGSDTTLAIYCTSIALPPLTLFLSQCGIHTMPFLHLVNCFCNISSFLFQVTVV